MGTFLHYCHRGIAKALSVRKVVDIQHMSCFTPANQVSCLLAYLRVERLRVSTACSKDNSPAKYGINSLYQLPALPFAKQCPTIRPIFIDKTAEIILSTRLLMRWYKILSRQSNTMTQALNNGGDCATISHARSSSYRWYNKAKRANDTPQIVGMQL